MNFLGNVWTNFINLFTSFFGSIAPTISISAGTETISKAGDLAKDNSTLQSVTMSVGSAVISAAMEYDFNDTKVKTEVTTSYIDALDEEELNEFVDKLESFIEEKPKTLTKSINK